MTEIVPELSQSSSAPPSKEAKRQTHAVLTRQRHFFWLRDCSQTNDCQPLATPIPCAHLLPFQFCQLWQRWVSYYIQRGEKEKEQLSNPS